jgi:hypothetical protein
MVNKTDVCNLALSWLGDYSISNIDDDSNQARTCKINYDLSLTAVLEEKDWSFAIDNKQVAKSPNGGFLKPPEALRVLLVNDDEKDWHIEGEYIFIERGDVAEVKFIQVVKEAKFSAMFVQALAARIAADIAVTVTGSKSMEANMQERYEARMQSASTTDSLQGTREELRASKLTTSRRITNPTGLNLHG